MKAKILSCLNGCLHLDLWERMEKKRNPTCERSSGTDVHESMLISLSLTSAWGDREHRALRSPVDSETWSWDSQSRMICLGSPLQAHAYVWFVGSGKMPGLWVSPGASPTSCHMHTCRGEGCQKTEQKRWYCLVP